MYQNFKKLIKILIREIGLFVFILKRDKPKFELEDAKRYLESLRKANKAIFKLNLQSNIYDLSIIIPIFNGEKFIDECLGSVFCQETSFSFEVIIIDDGSTDNSRNKINKYSDKIIYKYSSNLGPGNARNLGLEIAKGRYIMFVDSDDKLLPGSIDLILKKAYENNACIVQANHQLLFINENKSIEIKKFSFNVIPLADKQNYIFNLDGYPWAKVFKKELFINTPFPLLTFEDSLIWMTIYRKTKRLVTINEIVYEYTIHSDSETGRIETGNYKGIDTFYVVLYLIELNNHLKIRPDGLFYRQLIFQFGKIMYNRNKNLGKSVISALLTCSASILDLYENLLPNLTRKEKLLRKSILNQDYKLYKFVVKNYC